MGSHRTWNASLAIWATDLLPVPGQQPIRRPKNHFRTRWRLPDASAPAGPAKFVSTSEAHSKARPAQPCLSYTLPQQHDGLMGGLFRSKSGLMGLSQHKIGWNSPDLSGGTGYLAGLQRETGSGPCKSPNFRQITRFLVGSAGVSRHAPGTQIFPFRFPV
jgi:hypothetical protein